MSVSCPAALRRSSASALFTKLAEATQPRQAVISRKDLFAGGQAEGLGQMLVNAPIRLVEADGVAVYLGMLERGTHGSDRERLVAELLEAASACGRSLQKDLTLPRVAGLPIGSAASQHFANFYMNGLDHFVKHTLRVKGYLRYMDDLLLFGPDSAGLMRLKEAIAGYLHDRLHLTLHPAKTLLSKSEQGVEYLGYRVYPHHLHPCSRTIGALKARLDFFKHLFWPDRFALFQRPMRGVWQSLALSGELAPPLAPDWLLLKRMEATINSYYGIMGHAQSYKLRKSLYHKHFGPLRAFFLPADAAYSAVHVTRPMLFN